MDVDHWLDELGLTRYAGTFREQAIGFDVLQDLTESDLKELGVALGDCKRLMRAINDLADPNEDGALPNSPTGVALKPDSSGAQRRHLTVMFVDLVGSTALAERLDPEEMRDIIRAFQNSVAGEISRFEGYIARFMGDGVLAYFGYPRAHEDDAERSVRAGIAAVRAAESIETPSGGKLLARVGIATGVVVVGDLVGTIEMQEHDVVGGTPNLAARLQTLARPGHVVIADSTRKLLGDLFELEPLPPAVLKGIAAKVISFAVLGERQNQNRFMARRSVQHTELIGRSRELQALTALWERAMTGAPQAVLLAGEAGIGKSRLVHAFIDSIDESPRHTVILQCSPYHTESVLHPIVRHLRALIGAEGTTQDHAPFDRLKVLLSSAIEEDDQIDQAAALLARLLDIDVPHPHSEADIAPQELRARTLHALIEYLRGLAARQPLMFIFEDMQWVDPTSLFMLDRLLATLSDDRILVMMTSRPESLPDFSASSNLNRMDLGRLRSEDAATIIGELTGGKSFPADLVDVIVAKTDGVPLFVEELTKMVLESGFLEETESAYRPLRPLDSLAIPSSLHDSLMARLDRLESLKTVAQTASCIGRVFSYNVLLATSDRSTGHLDRALKALQDAGMVYREDDASEATYVFKHALVCDTAYESLLRSKRQAIHLRIISALKTRETLPELFAYHYERAALPKDAAQYLLQAGRAALEISAGREAIAYLERGIRLVETIEQSRDIDRLKLRLYALLGTGYMLTRSWGATEVETAYAKALALSDAAEDELEKIWVFWGAWVFRQVRGQIRASEASARQLVDIAEASHAADALLIARMVQMQVAFYTGRLRDSIRYGEDIARLYEPERHDVLRDSYSVDLLLVWHVHAAQCHWLLGNAAESEESLGAARNRARHIDHTYSRFWANVWCSNLHLLAGRHDFVLDFLPPIVEDAEQRGFDYVSNLGRLVLAAARMAHDGRREDVHDMDRALDDFHKTGAGIVTPYFQALEAQALCAGGLGARALEIIDTALADIDRDGERWSEALALRIKGDILSLLHVDDPAPAESIYRQAIAVAESQDAEAWRAQAELALAKLLIARGAHAEARAILDRLTQIGDVLGTAATGTQVDGLRAALTC